MGNTINIAIDGPAGAGKSTIAKKVAAKAGFIYVDTGAMFRAIALFLIEKGIEENEEEKITKAVSEADVTICYENGVQLVLLNGINVNDKIRNEKVGSMASSCSVYPEVRKKLLELQRKIAFVNNVVMDGRDIGTCVLPNAELKIYMTADSHVRAVRRYEELMAKGQTVNLEEIEKGIVERDYRDMHRSVAPLKAAEDAVTLDTSDMSIEEVVNKVLSMIP